MAGSSGTADFSDIPNGGEQIKSLFRVWRKPRRTFLLGGTVSNAQNATATVHLRIEIILNDVNNPPGSVVWTRNVTRELPALMQGFNLEVLSGYKDDLAPGAYSVRLKCLGAAVLLPTDSFFVVAIDMDDDVDPGAHTQGARRPHAPIGRSHRTQPIGGRPGAKRTKGKRKPR